MFKTFANKRSKFLSISTVKFPIIFCCQISYHFLLSKYPVIFYCQSSYHICRLFQPIFFCRMALMEAQPQRSGFEPFLLLNVRLRRRIASRSCSGRSPSRPFTTPPQSSSIPLWNGAKSKTLIVAFYHIQSPLFTRKK